MNHPYQYIGFFPEPKQFYQLVDGLRSRKLHRQITFPHVTVLYMPEDALQPLFGTEAEITVTGYGCDGKNEGLEVTLHCADPVLQELIRQIPVPHITLSVSRSGKPVNTRFLQFSPVEPITFRAVFGGFLDGTGPDTTP